MPAPCVCVSPVTVHWPALATPGPGAGLGRSSSQTLTPTPHGHADCRLAVTTYLVKLGCEKYFRRFW